MISSPWSVYPPYMQEHARENMWTGGDLVMTTQARYNPRLALVGALRAACMVACAALGYRSALDPRLTSVRHYILPPDAQVIDGWSVAGNQTEDDRSLLLLTEPLPAMLVKLGSIAVLFPWLSSPLNFYDVWAFPVQTRNYRTCAIVVPMYRESLPDPVRPLFGGLCCRAAWQ